jgi:hypothetical protein
MVYQSVGLLLSESLEVTPTDPEDLVDEPFESGTLVMDG